jgi:hypothetical protein
MTPGLARRPGRSWPRALPALAGHVAATMPWATLLAGCLGGTAILAVLAFATRGSHQALGQDAVRVTFLPAIAALVFVPRDSFRPVAQAAPLPGWLTSAGQCLLAAPVLVATCWAELALMDHTIAGMAAHAPAIYPLLAQLTGWCLLAVATAACCDRSRYADLGGAVAAPVTLAVIASAWYLPQLSRYLVTPPATRAHATATWYGVAAAALAVTGVAMRDRWPHYGRALRPRRR